MRAFLTSLFLLVTGLTAMGAGLPEIEVWKDPNCGCCNKWIAHLREAGFPVVAHDTRSVAAAREALGMPQRFGSCHSARVGDYVIEGHVPASDIRRLLEERPMARGLAVPGMPIGSPGMEGPAPEPYQVFLIGPGGNARVFSEH